jgi:peptidoglycan/xylan/chitin deacetylase (PgdA/CDA1 family)
MALHRRRLMLSLSALAMCGATRAAWAQAEDAPPPHVALTFDDGPHPEQTPRLLEILDREQVTATFYVIGSCAERCPDVVRQVFLAGHDIGNHSWSHPVLTRLSSEAVGTEISRTDDLLIAINGERPNTIRAPYGATNDEVRAVALPRSMMLWDVDTNDWRSRNTESVTREAVSRRGGVVLMHDIYPTTVAAVPAIIREYKARGFRFVTMSSYVEWTATDSIDLV